MDRYGDKYSEMLIKTSETFIHELTNANTRKIISPVAQKIYTYTNTLKDKWNG